MLNKINTISDTSVLDSTAILTAGNNVLPYEADGDGDSITIENGDGQQYYMPATPLEGAFMAVHMGFFVHPCRKDKVAMLKEWPKYATQDEETIRDWWRRYPDAMVGACTGHQAGKFVIDIDVVGNEDAYDKWAALEKEHGALNPVFVTSTPSGGLHLFCVMPEGVDLRNSTNKIADGVDIRANGGYVIFAGSTRSDGKQYRMLMGGRN
jgi:Bifunctional DNA primase/polymerase, N-terminal